MSSPSNYSLGGRWARERVAREIRETTQAIEQAAGPQPSEQIQGLIAGLIVAASISERKLPDHSTRG